MTHAEKSLRNAEIARRAMAGDSYKEIARVYDLHVRTIYLITRPALIAAGISRKQKKKRTRSADHPHGLRGQIL